MAEIKEEESIDDIIKAIREAIVEKERKKYFDSFRTPDTRRENDVFELSKICWLKGKIFLINLACGVLMMLPRKC